MQYRTFKEIISSFTVLSCLLAVPLPSFAEEFSFGIGLGSLYNGLGVNFGISKDKSLRYLALGCIGGSSSDEGDFSGICGIGAGYIKSGVFKLSPEHTLGGMISVNHDEKNDVRETFVGLSYHYMFSKDPAYGWGIGLTPGVIFRDSSEDAHFMLNLGYQF